jgi:hypothetical protein
VPRTATRATGHHEVDPVAERRLEAWARAERPARRPVPTGRQCGCSQNFTVRPRCIDCPAVEGRESA